MPVLLSGGIWFQSTSSQREHRERVVWVDLQRNLVRAGFDQTRDVKAPARVVTGEGTVGSDVASVEPETRPPNDTVHDELGRFTGLRVRREAGAKPPWDGELPARQRADRFQVAETRLHVFGVEHFGARTVLKQRPISVPGAPASSGLTASHDPPAKLGLDSSSPD